tara:strand:- start:2247 stop:2501 length:255 start_codon:yes stop_codon:yes gene_type:complete
MEKILLLVGGAYLGWYLALNKKKEVEQALAQAKREAKELSNEVKDLTDDLKAEINENDRLANLSVTEDVARDRRGVLLNSFIDG